MPGLGRRDLDAFQYPDLWDMERQADESVRVRLKDGYQVEADALYLTAGFRLYSDGSSVRLQKASGASWVDLEVWS